MNVVLYITVALLFFFPASYAYSKIDFRRKNYDYDANELEFDLTEYDAPSLSEQYLFSSAVTLPVGNSCTERKCSDLTAKYFNRNRYYSPAQGRFTSKDPISFRGGNNLYRYADNNPIIYTDPTGFIGANQIHTMSFGSINNFFNSINESPSNPKSATLYPVTKSNMSGAVVPIDEVCDCGPFMVQRVSAKLYDTVWDPTYSSTNPVTHTPFTGANVWKSFESMNPSDFYVIGNNIYFPSPMWDFITLRIILRCVPPS